MKVHLWEHTETGKKTLCRRWTIPAWTGTELTKWVMPERANEVTCLECLRDARDTAMLEIRRSGPVLEAAVRRIDSLRRKAKRKRKEND